MTTTFTGSLTVAAAAPITTGARCVLTIDGGTYVFDPEAGDELGVYYDPAGEFAQRNVVCFAPDLPDFRCYYRPDTDGDREEWVFEFGDPFDAAPVNLGAYTAQIVRADGTLITVEVPEHFHLSRWRWQSEPRPARRTPQELARDKLLPHYDASALAPYSKTHAPQTYTPMGLAGVMANQATTGERPDIGIVTDWQADYLCVGEGLGTILAQGDAAATIHMHVRAAPDGPPMDLFEWPNASMYNHSKSDPYILRTNCDVDGAPLKYDTGHSPTLAYVPWLLTGDPYYLEEVQFEANMDVVICAPPSRWRQNGRYLAWSLRNTLYALAATPESVPAWLQPRSYWQRNLDEYRAFVEERMTLGDPLHLITSGGSQKTPGWPAGSYFAAWQEDFLTAIFAIAVRQGQPEWTPALLWKLDCTTARVHSDTWHWPNPSPYQISLVYACALAADCAPGATTITVDAWGMQPWPALPFDVVTRDEPMVVTAINGNVWTVERSNSTKAHSVTHPVMGPGFAGWAECYARNRVAHPEIFPVNTTGDPNVLYTGKGSAVTYPGYTRGALALVVGEEVAGAESAVPAYEWIDNEFIRSASSSSWKLTRKWCIVSGPASDTLSADLRLIVVTGLRALAKLRRRGE